jgi:cyclic beta-1,2-glucan synthetase
MAFADQGDPEKAYAIFEMINPIRRSDEQAKSQHYRLEPYAVAGDIAAGSSHSGEGGWSWYTGAAGWTWQLAIKSILGLRLSEDEFTICPCIPPDWGGFKARVRTNGGTLLLSVEDPKSLGHGEVDLTVNGRAHSGKRVPLPRAGDQVEIVARIVGS